MSFRSQATLELARIKSPLGVEAGRFSRRKSDPVFAGRTTRSDLMLADDIKVICRTARNSIMKVRAGSAWHFVRYAPTDRDLATLK